MTCAKMFRKLDLNQGYNRLFIAPEPRYITTFSTNIGLMRYKRLHFDISSTAWIFQNAIREILEGIVAGINISDDIMVFREFLKVKSSNTSISCINIMYIDILVFGKSQEEYNLNLRAVFKQPQEKNPQQRQEEVGGYVFFLTMAYRPTLTKWKVWSSKTTSSEVRSMLRMINYL